MASYLCPASLVFHSLVFSPLASSPDALSASHLIPDGRVPEPLIRSHGFSNHLRSHAPPQKPIPPCLMDVPQAPLHLILPKCQVRTCGSISHDFLSARFFSYGPAAHCRTARASPSAEVTAHTELGSYPPPWKNQPVLTAFVPGAPAAPRGAARREERSAGSHRASQRASPTSGSTGSSGQRSSQGRPQPPLATAALLFRPLRHGRQPGCGGPLGDTPGGPSRRSAAPSPPRGSPRPRRAGNAAARLPQSKMAARPAPRVVKPRRPRRPRRAALTWHGHSACAQPRA